MPSANEAVIYLRVSTKDQAERGGDAEGFSIPAQREACHRKAEQLGATVADEFVDAGESARSAARPELQRMLTHLTERPTRYVIVHKVDRLARNRADDVEINLAIQRAGSTLVSVTENIDETPSGMLMHAIMSGIAEFYSRNLATESKKGMLQKAKNGGTPGMAPFGYRNVRARTDEGREIRTVEVDLERAEIVRWIFHAYVSGEWTMALIRDELAERGVVSLPRPKIPSRPLATSQIERILKNRYYTGYVQYEEAWYPGKHEALIPDELWQQAQDVRRGRVQSREKPRQHPHYLKGSLYCGQCGEALSVEVVRNRQGRLYRYFYCMGRQKMKNGCELKAMPIDLVEQKIEHYWQSVTIPKGQIDTIREEVAAYIGRVLPRRDREVEQAELTVRRLTAQRDKLLQAHYAGAVPLDQLKSEQDRISEQLAGAKELLGGKQLRREQLEASLDSALDLLAHAGDHYAGAPTPIRRQLNQSVFERFWLSDDEVANADLKLLFRRLLDRNLAATLRTEADGINANVGSQIAEATPSAPPSALDKIHRVKRPYGDLARKRKNQHPEGTGSNELLLVAGTGFEPVTSGLGGVQVTFHPSQPTHPSR
jgi:site-specific DNA recombinase